MRQVFTYLALVGFASATSLSQKTGESHESTEEREDLKAEFMNHCTEEGLFTREECEFAFIFDKAIEDCMSKEGADEFETCIKAAEDVENAYFEEKDAATATTDGATRDGENPNLKSSFILHCSWFMLEREC